jgi:hypothetical protein
MIQHFLYGLFDYAGYQLLKTPLVDQLLTRQHFQELLHIGNYDTKESLHRTYFPQEQVLALHRTYFPQEQVLAYSLCIPRMDSYGRKGVWNHTLLLTFKDYLDMTDPQGTDTPPPLHTMFIREPIDPRQFHPLPLVTP